MNFVVGQRWSSVSEPQLGLGIVVETEGRRITVSFPAVEETRTYAGESAPLARIIYPVGDHINDHEDNSYLVKEVNDLNGVVIYLVEDTEGQELQIPELELNCFIHLVDPIQRFNAGQIDRLSEYQLRIETLQHSNRLQQSPIKGLAGSRTSLLPHQVYIAQEVAKRHAPRVLLADEVGLGKTIEAGMILHHQIHTGQAQRVLILVPESLVHQWLVEMLRRFQLHFSVFNEERLLGYADETNPFDTEQQIICPINLFEHNEVALTQVLASDWDLVIVDEAHHLEWHPHQPSPAYQFVEELASLSKGLLLLTATPEQIGVDGHFARLRLLDPARFHSLDQFIEEQSHYAELNDVVKALIENKNITETSIKLLQKWLPNETLSSGYTQGNDTNRIIDDLLDRHGTGRVLFRNTRTAIQGFPLRKLMEVPLELPSIYQEISGSFALCPETQLDSEIWLAKDPRVLWLIDFLKTNKREKVLVICHQAETALALDKHLNLRAGIRSSSFYEGLTLIERDRAAAYFADNESGAQTLICSEIGSEGRNFQFAHHLVLFDLPENPDLLEQRIGRLDRIGQTEDIKIHVPYFTQTAQEVVFRWMNIGIGIFGQSCSAGHMIYMHFKDRLSALIGKHDQVELEQLISDTSKYTQKTIEALHQGRDALLERNSCQMPVAKHLIELIEQEESSDVLQSYMQQVFDAYGLDTEHHSSHAMIIQPSDNMRSQHFPGLKDHGNTLTFDREKALAREDMDFITWEHPMVSESMETILSGEMGNATLAVLPIKALPPATILLELWFYVEVQANKSLQIGRYLPIKPTRMLVDINGKELSQVVNYEQLNKMAEPVGKQKVVPIVAQIKTSVETMYRNAVKVASKDLENIQIEAAQKAKTEIGAELDRLAALRLVNPSVRQEELDHFKTQLNDSIAAISRAEIQCQGMRVLITRQ